MKTLIEITKEIRKELKTKFPEWKFSVTTPHRNKISVALMEGPRSPFVVGSDGHEQLNHYYIERDTCLTDEAKKMMIEVNEIANKENWDHSDIQTDYFNVNYYFSLSIGKWDRKFQIKN